MNIKGLTVFIFFSIVTFVIGIAKAHQPHDAIHSVEMSPNYSADKTFLVSLDQGSQFIVRGVGILKSIDGGETFEPIPDVLGGDTFLITRYSPDYINDKAVYAAIVHKGLYKSIDGGSTWQKVEIGSKNIEITSISLSPGFKDDRTIYVG